MLRNQPCISISSFFSPGLHTFVSASLNLAKVSFIHFISLWCDVFFISLRRKLIFSSRCFCYNFLCFFSLLVFEENKFLLSSFNFSITARFAMLLGKLIVKSNQKREWIRWSPARAESWEGSLQAICLAQLSLRCRGNGFVEIIFLYFFKKNDENWEMFNREWKENFYGNSDEKKISLGRKFK